MALLEIGFQWWLYLLIFIRNPTLIRPMTLIRFSAVLSELSFVNGFKIIHLHLFQIIGALFLLFKLILGLENDVRLFVWWALGLVIW